MAWHRFPRTPSRRCIPRPAALTLRAERAATSRSAFAEQQHSRRLSWSDLYQAAQLAAWSGLCYMPWSTLPERLAEQQLELVACGRCARALVHLGSCMLCQGKLAPVDTDPAVTALGFPESTAAS